MRLPATLGAWCLLLVCPIAAGCDGSEEDGGAGGSSSTQGGGGHAGASTTGGLGGGGQAGAGGQGGGSGGGDPNVLTNNDATCEQSGIEPQPTEHGHWAAARLTPKSYPFSVATVRYRLFDEAMDTGCNDFEHEVALFVSPDPAPPATPTVVES